MLVRELSILEQGTSFLAPFEEYSPPFCVCVHVSGEEISSVPGQGSPLSSKTGTAHPDGPPSQPHALHRSQVTNSNRLRLCVTDVFALMFLLSFDSAAPICCQSAEDIQSASDDVSGLVVECQIDAVCPHTSCTRTNKNCCKAFTYTLLQIFFYDSDIIEGYANCIPHGQMKTHKLMIHPFASAYLKSGCSDDRLSMNFRRPGLSIYI